MPKKVWMYLVIGLVGYAVFQGIRNAISRAISEGRLVGPLVAGIGDTLALADGLAAGVSDIVSPAVSAVFPEGLGVPVEEVGAGVVEGAGVGVAEISLLTTD